MSSNPFLLGLELGKPLRTVQPHLKGLFKEADVRGVVPEVEPDAPPWR
jgi:hypothetical protein